MNRLKLYIIIGTLFVLVTGTLSHFVYGWTGNNPAAGLFFPVNEYTWEHMKLVFFPTLVYGIFLYNKLREEYPCIKAAIPAGILAGTFSVPVLFYTYSGILGKDNFILDIAVFILSVLIAFRIKHLCTKTTATLLSIAVVLLAVSFMLFSYNPPKLGIFAEPPATMQE